MNLNQFRCVREVVRHELNVTETAQALGTSQPGLSKAIIELEQELDIEIFARNGKRLVSLTDAGERVLACIQSILNELGNLQRVGEHFSGDDGGTLSVATTHTQARYILPGPVSRFLEEPRRSMRACTRAHRNTLREWCATKWPIWALPANRWKAFPAWSRWNAAWQHVLLIPEGHVLASRANITLKDLAMYPLVTYQPAYTGRSRIDRVFAQHGLDPRIALEGIDSDAIKTYVRLGLGLGLVAEIAVRNGKDRDLIARPMGELFGTNTAHVAFRQGAFLRRYVYRFAELISPSLTIGAVEQAVRNALRA